MKSPLKTYLDSNMVVYSQGNNNNAHRLFSLWRKLTDVQHELEADDPELPDACEYQ